MVEYICQTINIGREDRRKSFSLLDFANLEAKKYFPVNRGHLNDAFPRKYRVPLPLEDVVG